MSTLRLTGLLLGLISSIISMLPAYAEGMKTASPSASNLPAEPVKTGCREASFAGVWYDRDPVKLRAYIGYLISTGRSSTRQWKPGDSGSSEFVRSSSAVVVPDGLVAAIVPHATYQYSGSTAALFYKQIQGHKFDRVFILGPAHREHFHGCALPLEKYFCTPLGRLPVDTVVVGKLKTNPSFKAAYDLPHKEHSIELQLPLIQQSLGTLPIVPIEIGNLSGEMEVKSVSRALRRVVTDRDLVIVSSDFTHYGPHYKFQPFPHGRNLSRQIEKLDADAFRSIKSGRAKNFIDFQHKTHDTICGLYPCAVLLAMLQGKSQVTLLDYENSFDVNKAPDGNRVSYMTIVFSRPKSAGVRSN